MNYFKLFSRFVLYMWKHQSHYSPLQVTDGTVSYDIPNFFILPNVYHGGSTALPLSSPHPLPLLGNH